MDKKPQDQREIQRLIALAESSRQQLQADVAALRQRLDLPSRIRSSLGKHPSSWMLGSLFSGIAVSMIFRRKPKIVAKSRIFPTTLMGLTLTAVRPLVKVWLAGVMKKWAADALAGKLQLPSSFLRNLPPSTSAKPEHVRPPSPGPR
jgi:hypothetical protein